jgi:hypothetical protein
MADWHSFSRRDMEHTPHPANVPGDFYVVDSCCTMCEVPFLEAPALFGAVKNPQGYEHCYVKRQPASPAELDQMVNAIRCAELQCIRYRGADRLIQLSLVEYGEGVVCDLLPADLQARAAGRDVWEHLPQDEPPPPEQSIAESSKPSPWWRFW